MSQHYTGLTVEASAWCQVCFKMTPHRVAEKRLQYCIPCYERPKLAVPDSAPAAAEQLSMFGADEP